MKPDHREIAAMIIGLTFVSGTAAPADPYPERARATTAAPRPACSFRGRTVRYRINRGNTSLNHHVNRGRNVNVNRNINHNRNANWHGSTEWHNGHWYNGVWHAGYRGAAAVGAAAAVTAAAIGSTVYSLPSGCGNVNVGGVGYYQCGPTWYQRQYSGGSTAYVVVNPPQ